MIIALKNPIRSFAEVDFIGLRWFLDFSKKFIEVLPSRELNELREKILMQFLANHCMINLPELGCSITGLAYLRCLLVCHKLLEFPVEGAVLEGGEEGVQFGEVGALRGLLALDGCDDGGKFLLEGKRGNGHFQISEYL